MIWSRTFWKLFLGNLLVMVLLAAMVVLLAYRRLDENYQLRSREDQDTTVRLLAERFQSVWPMPPADVDRLCKSTPRAPSARVTVVAPDGQVLGDSDADPAHMVNHADRREIMSAFAGRLGDDVRRSETLGVEFRYVAVPILHDGKPAGAMRLAVPIRAIAEAEAFFRDALLVAALAAVAVAGLLSLVVNWMWAAPLNRMSRAARQIAGGDLNRRVRAEGGGELANLGRAINEMRDGLVGQIQQTRAEQQNLRTVLAGLREGIVAVSPAGMVAMMNQAAADLLSARPEEAVGRKLDAVVPHLTVLNLYRDAVAAGRSAAAQLNLDLGGAARVLEVHATPVSAAAPDILGLLVLRDVTELANAASMKSQFVANASHELRTPLATVRAAVDALADIDPADRETLARCLSILDGHVGRLEALTRDLLDLHLVESGKLALNIQEVSLNQLADKVRAEFEPRCADKKIAITVAAVPPGRSITTDPVLLDLILRNLVDNAIKFTPEGGQVECSLESTAEGLTVRVRDTGIGISRQDQARVFERFFQVSSSRTGDARLRGTGLGLAIVKHASERLGAKVELSSTVGKGTTITVSLPERHPKAAAR